MVDTSSLSFSEEKVSGDGCSGAIAVSDLSVVFAWASAFFFAASSAAFFLAASSAAFLAASSARRCFSAAVR
ncbi:Uncharacterised protein [Bacteroides xylanisolvens]|nr:Uncharacterised protein [Bacteroides xylanisolvens]